VRIERLCPDHTLSAVEGHRGAGDERWSEEARGDQQGAATDERTSGEYHWSALRQLVGGRGQRQVDQAARLQVEGTALIKGQRARSIEIVDERLTRFGRHVAVHEQAEVVVDQGLGGRDAVCLDLSG